jgi:hypothetical protein
MDLQFEPLVCCSFRKQEGRNDSCLREGLSDDRHCGTRLSGITLTLGGVLVIFASFQITIGP